AMQQATLDAGQGNRISLNSVFEQAFTSHRQLSLKLAALPPSALVGKPSLNEAAIEFPDRLVLVREVHVVLRDPRAAAAAVPELASFLSPVDWDAAAKVRVRDLKPEEQSAFRTFLSEELPRLMPDDPVRLAYASGGEDAALRAIARGEGEFSVIDQIVVPQQLVNDGSMRLAPEFRPLLQQSRQPLTLPPFKSALSMQTSKGLKPASLAGPAGQAQSYAYSPGARLEGSWEFSEPFLNGYTLGQELAWERRWKFSGGFLRISYGMGYGLGLRIPYYIKGRLDPSSIIVSAVEDRGQELRLSISASTKDGDETDYRRTGLPTTQIFSGDEFVCTAGSWISFKLYAMGRTLAQFAPVNTPWNQNRSFLPPLGSNPQPIFSVEIPPELTNTGIAAGPLQGALQVGLGLHGTGSILAPVELYPDETQIDRKNLALNDRNTETVSFLLPPRNSTPHTLMQYNYGIRIGAPVYILHAEASVRLRLMLRIDASVIKRSIATDWFDILTVPLHRVMLPPHAGTRSYLEWQEGRYIFEARDPGDTATMQPVASPPRLP
ncbi:MAG: hypothetical protein QHH01_07315, partial [Spirochaetales bacterium]|nr:hypothetical protein [Spirochaetales bacterium]